VNVKELVDTTRPDDGPLALYCGKCGSVYSLKAGLQMREYAEKCCLPKRCPGCDKDTGFSGLCHDCHDAKRFEVATKVPASEYTGWVAVGDDYFDSVASLIERRQDEDAPLPKYVWGTTETTWDGLDVESALENELENSFEDAIDHVTDMDELRAFVKAWNEKQSITSYWCDYKTAVILDEA